MKNKRNVLIAFILICCLCLSIGYAALTDTLYINGSANVNADGVSDNNDIVTPWEQVFDTEVYFVDTDDVDATTVGKGDVDGDNDRLTINVPADTFKPAVGGNTAVFTAEYTSAIEVADDSEYAAEIELKAPVATTNFSYAVAWDDNEGNSMIRTLQPGDQVPVKVTITLLNTTPSENLSDTFSVNFKAIAKEPTNN